jgi:hypothetical protein
MSDDLVKRLREVKDWWREPGRTAEQAADRIEALEKALRRLVSWGAACPTEREDRLSHAAEGAKAFHAARAALGEDVHD